jgi:hypothetical protein
MVRLAAMKQFSAFIGALAFSVLTLHAAAVAPVPDSVYLQEWGRKVSSESALRSVAVAGAEILVASDQGVFALEDGHLVPRGLALPIRRLRQMSGSVFAMGPSGLHRHDGSAWTKITDEAVADVTEWRGRIVAAGPHRLWRVDGAKLTPLSTNDAPFEIQRVVEWEETLYLEGQGRVTPFNYGRIGVLDVFGSQADMGWDWGTLPSPRVRDAVAWGPRLVLGTDRGLGLLRGMSVSAFRGEDGMPFEDVLCLATGFTNDLWVGTSRGALRWTDGAWHYFAGKRWLPSDHVNGIAAAGRSVYIATDGGLGIVNYEPYTLLKKAAYYERHLEEWGQKRLGLVHKLEWDEGLKEFVREAGDNDGGYSGDYLAAESYRYAVTHDPAARREATNTFHALCWLRTLTGIPGFPARSVWVKGERGHKSAQGSGGYPAEWHTSADARFEWKGDTSSDELCSHFYAVARFLELAAEGDEVRLGREHIAAMASHLIDHGWRLIDVDGQPTRWGRWDPDYFLTDEGHYDRGLQCLELLSFMKTAETLTGDPKFAAAGRRLIELGYPGYTIRQRQTQPPEDVAHFEDELACWSYFNLFAYEKDADLRSIYRRSFARTYETIRVEMQPWFNYVHAAVTRTDEEAAVSAGHLREWPLDLHSWSYENSIRTDLRTPPGYRVFKGGVRAYSPREREGIRWDSWTLQADGGADGRDVTEPSGWLLAYWMGRYYGFIEPPTATDPAVLTAAHSLDAHLGARPYAGPARPAP